MKTSPSETSPRKTSPSIDAITYLIGTWIQRHGRDIAGVKVTIEFPSRDDAFYMEDCIKAELQRHQHLMASERGITVETMNGIALRVTYRRPLPEL